MESEAGTYRLLQLLHIVVARLHLLQVVGATIDPLAIRTAVEYTYINEGVENMVTVLINGVEMQVAESVLTFVIQAWQSRGVKVYVK